MLCNRCWCEDVTYFHGVTVGAWKDVTLEELKAFFWSQHCYGNCKIAGGLNVLASEMAYKCACLWSSYAQDFALFACLMTLRLFLLDNQDMTSCANLNKVNWNCFFPNFEKTYNIHRNISIDECIIP